MPEAIFGNYVSRDNSDRDVLLYIAAMAPRRQSPRVAYAPPLHLFQPENERQNRIEHENQNRTKAKDTAQCLRRPKDIIKEAEPTLEDQRIDPTVFFLFY